MTPPALTRTGIDELAKWAEGLRTASAQAQAEVLSEADALRDGNDGLRFRALLAYRALADRIAEPTAANLDRLAWVLEEDANFDRTSRACAERASTHPDPKVRLRAELTIAVCDGRDGRIAEAERAIRGLQPRLRGRGDLLEVEAWHELSRVYAKGGREVEALLTARRADALMGLLPEPHPKHVAKVETALAESYACLDDWPRLVWALDRLDEWTGQLHAPDAFRTRVEAAFLRIDAAIGRGDAIGARRRLEELVALDAARPRSTPWRRSLATERARVALLEGRPALALEWANEAVNAGAPPSATLDLVEVTARKRLGDPRARERASYLLDAVGAEAAAGTMSPGTRLRLADGLGRLFEASIADGDLAGRAFRDAAAAALARLAEIERATRDLTEVTDPDGDDRDALAGYRVGFWRRHGQVLGALAQTLGAAARRGERPPWADLSADGLVAVCAWCRSLRAPDGRWLPIGHLVLTVDSLAVTHGMCDACFERMSGEDG